MSTTRTSDPSNRARLIRQLQAIANLSERTNYEILHEAITILSAPQSTFASRAAQPTEVEGIIAGRRAAMDLGWDIPEHIIEVIAAAVSQQPAHGPWTGWAVQYPGRLPKIFGTLEIAELNWCPREGAALIQLVEVARR